MSTRDPETLKALEAKYRGLAIEDGLREAAEALATQIGTPVKVSRSHKDASQYPFERALAEHFGDMEARYGSLFDGAPDAMLVADRNGEILFVNASAAKQFGYERGDLLAKKLPSLVEGRVIDQIGTEGAAAALAADAQLVPAPIELVGIRRDGSRFPVEATFSLVNADGHVVLVAALRDIGSRKATERRLISDELSARTLFDQSPAALVLVNRRGRIVQVNAEAERLFGYDRNEINGELATAVLPQDLADQMLAAMQQKDAEVSTKTAGTWLRYDGRSKAGGELAFEATISTVQREQGWVAVAAVRQLDAASTTKPSGDWNKLRLSILEAIPDAVVAVNTRGDIVFASAEVERCFGYLPLDVVGHSIVRLVPEGFLERLNTSSLHSIEAALAREIGTRIELIGARKDGARFPLEVLFARLDMSGETLTIATLRDASLRRSTGSRAVAQAQSAALPISSVGAEQAPATLAPTGSGNELRQLTYFVAHDLQEPLRMIASYSRLLAERYGAGLDPDANDFIGYVVAGTRQMQGLVGDLLGYCRLETAPVRSEHVAISEVLDQTRSSLRTAIVASGATITQGELPEVIGDRIELLQVFQNLIGNAIKYRGAASPLIDVSAARTSPKFWDIAVTDNGIGIDSRQLEQIFVLFERLRPGGPISGSGIGLATCKRIVERHGGRIWVESRPEHGSTFHFTIPGLGDV